MSITIYPLQTNPLFGESALLIGCPPDEVKAADLTLKNAGVRYLVHPPADTDPDSDWIVTVDPADAQKAMLALRPFTRSKPDEAAP